jgi:hypothetical protein
MKCREEYLLKVFNRFAGLRTKMIKEKKNLSKRNSVNTNETTTNCTLKKND